MRRDVRACLVMISPLVALLAAGQAGLRVNYTDSMPHGIYWRIPFSVPEKGDLVLYQPTPAPVFEEAWRRGLSPHHPLLKRLAAVEGDVVSIDDAGVVVNGRRLTNSAPLAYDPAGRPMPVCRLKDYRLSPGEVLLMSDYSPVSFDGRYFGTSQRAQIQSVVRAVWTW